MPKSSRQHIVNRVHEDAETTRRSGGSVEPDPCVAGCILRIDRRNVLHADPARPRAETIITVARFAAPALAPSAPPTLRNS
jgi:hypothetical protein